MPRRQVLVVMSSADNLTLRGERGLRTGYFLNELAIPLMRIMEAGFNPVFANPKGNMPAPDPRSDSAFWFRGRRDLLEMSKRMLRELESFRTPRRLDDVVLGGLGEFTGLFVPGGHAPMEDLHSSRPLGRALEHFYEEGKPVGLICHGPIALLSALDDPQAFVAALTDGRRGEARELARRWPYRGYRITGFSDLEERLLGLALRLRGQELRMRFTLEQAMRLCGAEYIKSVTETVCRDRELITGQGPWVADRFAHTFVGALREEKAARLIRRAA